jgi:2-C-methyl-D-erythritol 2,4-cyclodiphosphate synthase
MRIGQGFDAHRYTEGSEITLGGVTIPHKFGIEAHSDGDVLLHAICDALLGAAGLGDIGKHYSDQDSEHINRDSREFVVDITSKIQAQNLNVVNVDATVILQSPKIAPYIDQMCQIIADDLKLDVSAVNVKATTTERMGFVGREEGIAAMAVVLLQ